MIDTSKPVDRTGNRFCGPLVAAALLGCSSGLAAVMIQKQRSSSRPVKSVRAEKDLLPLVQRHGYKVSDAPLAGARYRRVRQVWASSSTGRFYYARNMPAHIKPISAPADAVPWTLLKREAPTLDSWLCRIGPAQRAGTFIVRVTGHVLVLHGGLIAETYTAGEWVPWHSVPNGRRRVQTVWRVETC